MVYVMIDRVGLLTDAPGQEACPAYQDDTKQQRRRQALTHSCLFHTHSTLETLETLHVHDKTDRAAHQHLDRAGHECADRGRVRREDVDELLAGLAAIADGLHQTIHLFLLHADEQGHVALAQEAAGAADLGELEPVAQQRLRDLIFVPVMDDRDDQFHPSYSISSKIDRRSFQACRTRATISACSASTGRSASRIKNRAGCFAASVKNPSR